MNVIKPLQVICSHVPCRRRQVVPGDRIWFVDVRSGPGSHRQAGWSCRFCGKENATLPSHLPRGTIIMLPPRDVVLDRVSRKAVPKRQDSGADASDSSLLVVSTKAAPPEPPDRQTQRTSGIAPNAPQAVELPVQGAGGGTILTAATHRTDAERSMLGKVGQPGRPAPFWTTGRVARDALVEAFARIARHGGHAMAISTGRDGFEQVDIRLPEGGRMTDIDIAALASTVLDELERKRVDVLVLGGSVNGRPWQAIMHVSAGAASFV